MIIPTENNCQHRGKTTYCYTLCDTDQCKSAIEVQQSKLTEMREQKDMVVFSCFVVLSLLVVFVAVMAVRATIKESNNLRGIGK